MRLCLQKVDQVDVSVDESINMCVYQGYLSHGAIDRPKGAGRTRPFGHKLYFLRYSGMIFLARKKLLCKVINRAYFCMKEIEKLPSISPFHPFGE